MLARSRSYAAPPAADAEQPLAHDQVRHQPEVDDERQHPHPGDLLGQLVHLQREEQPTSRPPRGTRPSAAATTAPRPRRPGSRRTRTGRRRPRSASTVLAPSRLWIRATVGLCCRSMLSTSASGLAAGRICANSCCSEVWAFSNRRTATPSSSSTARAATARPRTAAGPWRRAAPGRAGRSARGRRGRCRPARPGRSPRSAGSARPRPPGWRSRSRAARASSSGAYVACPCRAQPRRFQSTPEACPVAAR